MLGAVIAGGRSSRFGSDKAVAILDGRALIDHAVAVLRPYVTDVVLCGRTWNGMTALADPVPDLGPLGGIAAALTYAESHGFDSVLTIACDMPEVPREVIDRLLAHSASYCTSAPILGHWPAHFAAPLYAYVCASEDAFTLNSGPHDKQSRLSIRHWADSICARPIGARALRNINTPADLA